MARNYNYSYLFYSCFCINTVILFLNNKSLFPKLHLQMKKKMKKEKKKMKEKEKITHIGCRQKGGFQEGQHWGQGQQDIIQHDRNQHKTKLKSMD